AAGLGGARSVGRSADDLSKHPRQGPGGLLPHGHAHPGPAGPRSERDPKPQPVTPALALLWLAGLAAHDAPVFGAQVRLVVLHPTVRHGRGELVTNLDRDAFRVFENGKPQTITVFHREDVLVSVGILIDNSGSMGP